MRHRIIELDRNLEKLRPFLTKITRTGILNQIGGLAVPAQADAWIETNSPVDDSLIARVARSGSSDVDAAARAAKAAFLAWRDMAAEDRKRILHAIADAIVERAEEIALCECWYTGQALRFMSKAAQRGADNFRFFADRAASARDGQALPSSTLINFTTREPLGPVGIITP